MIRSSAIDASTFAIWRTEVGALLALAWPMILTNLAQNAMQTINVMMLGRLGPEALAAGTLGFNMYFTPMMLGMGLMLAVSPMVSSEIGRRAHSVRDVRRTVRQGLWLAICVSIPVWALLWNGERLLVAMGQEPSIAADAGAYLRAMQWAILPFYGFIVLRSFVSALERPGWALVIMVLAVGVNAFVNWCLMFGNLGFPAMGVTGAGLGTTIACLFLFGAMSAVVSLERRFRRYRVFGRFWRPDWPRFFDMLWLGLPIGGILVFEVSLFGAAALLMGLISAQSLAAHAIAIQIASLAFMVPLGIGQAATVRVGRAFGAGNSDAVGRAGRSALLLATTIMAAIALLMVSMPQMLIQAFMDVTDPANAQVVALAVSFLAIAALFQIVDGAQVVAAGMLRGLHDTRIPMLYAALGYWGVGMPLGAFLAFRTDLAGTGLWLGLSGGLAVVAAMLVTRWSRRHKRVPNLAIPVKIHASEGVPASKSVS